MSLGKDIRDYLTSGGVSDVYVGELPERPAAALVVTPTAGTGPMRTFSAALANAPVERARVQLRARAADYAACSTLMTSAYQLLSGLQERTINSRRYYYCEAVQTPYYLGLDEAARPTIAVNFDILRAEST